MPRVIVFDVNETLLDLRALDPSFERAFGDASVRTQWFQQMLLSAFVATITDRYRDFGTLGRGALRMIAEKRGKGLGEEELTSMLRGMRQLPAYPEVAASIGRLRDAGMRIAALTNSTLEVAEAQLTHAGIRDLFERVCSADTVRRLKPAAEPYRAAAQQLGVDTSGMRLVAAHAWDIAGALGAGCAAAFVARPGQVLDPLVERPDIVGRDLAEVADRIIAAERP